ncbi:MAG: hypothetical protein ACK5LX_15945 [Oscillospiraceae bacterium]
MTTIAVTSGKGGTGKSCVTAYTGVAFAKRGKRTLVVEMGGSPRSLDLILGAQNDILFDYSDVVHGRCEVSKAIVQTAYHSGLYLMPGPPLPVPLVPEIKWFRTFLRSFKDAFDIVLLDGVNFHAFPPVLTDNILLVVTPESLAIRSTGMHSRALYDAGAKEIRLVINNVSAQVMPMYGARDFDDVIDTIGAQLIAVVPTSPILQYCSNNAQAVDEGSLTVQVFDNIAARLLGEHPLLLVK